MFQHKPITLLSFQVDLLKRPIASKCIRRMKSLHAKNCLRSAVIDTCLAVSLAKQMESDAFGPQQLLLPCSSFVTCGFAVWHRSWVGLHSRRCQADHI